MTFSLFDLAFVGSLAVAPPPVSDADAQAYLTAVEAADGQLLEAGVRSAINNFVIGCKNDGIWNAIKASCILAGARTLAGALVPLVGTAPTNNNFVEADYNRETGLVGDGSTKYLDSNRNNNADPQNSNHNAAYISFLSATNGTVMGATGVPGLSGTNFLSADTSLLFSRNRSGTGIVHVASLSAGFVGVSRSSSSSYTARGSSTNYTASVTSQTSENQDIFVFRRADVGLPLYALHRLAFYSIGESLDLALLDARVTALINAIAAAIP